MLSKRTNRILQFLDGVCQQILFKFLICDRGRENYSKEVREWAKRRGAKIHLTTPYHNQSNSRVERFDKTILDAFNKCKLKGFLSARIKEIIKV